MSRDRVTIGITEVLEVIQESKLSLTNSTEGEINVHEEKPNYAVLFQRSCNCLNRQEKMDHEANKLKTQNEEALRQILEAHFDKEKREMKERFDMILRNEQIRMLQMQKEAQRKCQDRIDALKSQLECRNLAGLMYVMCSERTKNKIEKMAIIQAYTDHINALQDLLIEGRAIILHLSKGYKTAAQVDYEWREKMKEVVNEFQCFLHKFMGGPPETVQYLLDLENLLKSNAPLYPDTDDNDDISDELELPISQAAPEVLEENKNWWESVDGEDRPFVVFGDMENMNPGEKVEINKKIKAAKTAPAKWKKYVFDDMYFKATCENLPKIKDLFRGQEDIEQRNVESLYNRTTYNTDQGRAIGTVLKYIVNAGGTIQTAANRNALASGILAAKDSLEILSTVKKDRFRNDTSSSSSMTSCEKILLGFKKGSKQSKINENQPTKVETKCSSTSFKSIQDDSFQISRSAHIPRNESQLNYDVVCPLDKCKNLRMDSFLAALPAYMRRSRRNIDLKFEDYEPCSPEQLQLIEQQLEEKSQKEKKEEKEEDVLYEWKNFADGKGTQTSSQSIIPPCTCPPIHGAKRTGTIDGNDFLPIKHEVDYIPKERLFDSQIEFQRFKVIGDPIKAKKSQPEKLLQDLKMIFCSHPSVTSLFNTN